MDNNKQATFDIYFNISNTIQNDSNTNSTTSTRKSFKNLNKADMKTKVNELIDSIPDDAESYYLEVMPSISDQIDAALSNNGF